MTQIHPATVAVDITLAGHRRRQLLAAGGGLALVALAGCSKQDAPAAAPAPATPARPATAAGTSREIYDAATRGTGFVVGQAMAARSMLVFFDPQCPHCATLWLAAKPLRDRIRMVWMPVAFIRPSSAPQGATMLAAQDPVATMDRHESLLKGGQGGLLVTDAPDAGKLEAVRANTDLWRRLNGESVPFMAYRISAEGPYGSQTGGMPTAQLAQLLEL